MSEYQPLPEIIIPPHLSQVRKNSIEQILKTGKNSNPDEGFIVLPRSGNLAIAGLKELLAKYPSFPPIRAVRNIGGETYGRFLEYFMTKYPDELTPELGEFANDEDLEEYKQWLEHDPHVKHSLDTLSPAKTYQIIDDTIATGRTIQTLRILTKLHEININTQPIFIFKEHPDWIRELLVKEFSSQSEPSSITGLFLNDLSKGKTDRPDRQTNIKGISPLIDFQGLRLDTREHGLSKRATEIIQRLVEVAPQIKNPNIKDEFNTLFGVIQIYGTSIDQLPATFHKSLVRDFNQHIPDFTSILSR